MLTVHVNILSSRFLHRRSVTVCRIAHFYYLQVGTSHAQIISSKYGRSQDKIKAKEEDNG